MVMGLTTSLWVQAQIRLCNRAFKPAALLRRGDADAGAVLLKVNRFERGCIVWTQTTNLQGDSAWMRGTGATAVPEADADAYIARQVGYDSDLWVIEIEDREADWQPPGQLV